MIYRLSAEHFIFPDPREAEEDGLLAIGGDLHPQRLLNAYKLGIFPWFEDDQHILWYAPHERFVLFPENFKLKKSFRQMLKRHPYRITKNLAFAEVIAACAQQYRPGQEGTWITEGMQQAYTTLHKHGWAHSIEVWDQDELVGGLYGVHMGNVFCGESMFSKVSNASKLALHHLCTSFDYSLIDCQVHTEHLSSLGAEWLSADAYREYLPSSQF